MNVTATSSPHIWGKRTTGFIMGQVLLALLPAVVMSAVFFGVRALMVEAICILTAVLGEGLWNAIVKRHNTLPDGSAVLTGLLLALTLPVSVPYWAAAVGSFFAIIVVKGMCGGIGQNIFNPALGGRAFLLAVWPVYITRFADAGSKVPVSLSTDMVSSATPLHEMQRQALPSISLWDAVTGNMAGSIGEVSAVALLAGGIYLMVRKIISPHIPAAYLGTVAFISFVFCQGEAPVMWMLYSLLSGGVILGAIFMATDYATSPVTSKGKVVYGIGAGVLTMFFRYTGLFPEGVTYAILLMNAATWLIDKNTAPRRFGVNTRKMFERFSEKKRIKNSEITKEIGKGVTG